MANWSYLCATNRKVIYPSYGDKPYDARQQTVASETYCVPLLWLALFRPPDLVERTFTQEGKTFVALAPLCARSKAIRQFRSAWPHLEKLFEDCGRLDGFAELFLEALEPLRYRYLTIELEQIECMAKSRKWFRDTLRAALAGIENDHSPRSAGAVGLPRATLRPPPLPARKTLPGQNASLRRRLCAARPYSWRLR